MPYYIKRDGKQVGPYARAELKDMLKHGEVRGAVAAKEDGDREWSTVEKCLRGENVVEEGPSVIPARFRGASMVPNSLRSSLGFTAYRKFAAATRNAARSVSTISLHRRSPRASVQSVKSARESGATGESADFFRDLIFGSIAIVGSALAMILGFVFAGNSPMGDLFWIFGLTAIVGVIFFVRGIRRFMAKP
jgi:hypothetical protein